jgi:ketosteroid isomerase-like protein
MIAAVLAAAALLSACGRGEEREVRDTLERYAEAVERKDYQALCDDLLSRDLIENLRRVGKPCEIALQDGFEDVQGPTIEIKRIEVDGDTASAVARTDAANQDPSEDTIRLAKEDGDWKIFDLTSA